MHRINQAKPFVRPWPRAVLLAAVILVLGWRALGSFAHNLAAIGLRSGWKQIAWLDTIPQCLPSSRSLPSVASAARLSLMVSGASAPAQHLLARLEWVSGDCESAQRSLIQLVREYPDDVLAAADLFWLQGARSDQIPAIIGTAKLAHYTDGRGGHAQSNQSAAGAIAWYELSIKIAPSLNVADRLADLYRKNGAPGNILDMWQRISVATALDQAEHWWAEGQLAEQNKQWETAARNYAHGAELTGKPYTYRIREAEMRQHLEDWAGVERAYEAASLAQPGSVQPYLGLGHVRRLFKDYPDALKWYQQAEAVSPNNPGPPFFLGELWFDQGNCAQAAPYFERVVALDPNQLKSIYYLSICVYQQGDRERALELLSRAIELNSDRPWQWASLLGDWRLEVGDHYGAQVAYEQALTWKPDDFAVQTKLKQLVGNK